MHVYFFQMLLFWASGENKFCMWTWRHNILEQGKKRTSEVGKTLWGMQLNT